MTKMSLIEAVGYLEPFSKKCSDAKSDMIYGEANAKAGRAIMVLLVAFRATRTAAPAPNVQALVEALTETLAAEDDYWSASRAAASALPRLYPEAKHVLDAASRRRAEARRHLAAIQAPAGEGVSPPAGDRGQG